MKGSEIMNIKDLAFTIEVKNIENLDILKEKLSGIKSLTNKLEEEISSILNVAIELKPK